MARFFMMYTTLIVFAAVMFGLSCLIGVTVVPLTGWAMDNGFAWLVWSWIALSLFMGPYFTYRSRSRNA
jgi:hypothetical protein